jgi:kynurenine formamidase
METAWTGAEEAGVELFGRRLRVLDLSHELSPEMPHYPGHMKTATWWHLTHEECMLRLAGVETEFEGYGVRGLATCDHVSTHVDAIYHFNRHRPDLTIDRFPLELMFTPAAWIDVSFVPPRQHIRLADVRRALDDAGVALRPGMTLLYWTGVERHWNDPTTYVTQYPGLDGEATDWLLDQGLVNVCTDASSTDNPADPTYPNHLRHGRRLVVHTENLANITRIPRHQDFYFLLFPLKLAGGTGCPVRALALWE